MASFGATTKLSIFLFVYLNWTLSYESMLLRVVLVLIPRCLPIAVTASSIYMWLRAFKWTNNSPSTEKHCHTVLPIILTLECNIDMSSISQIGSVTVEFQWFILLFQQLKLFTKK